MSNNMFIKDAVKVINRKTNEKYDCFAQIVELNFDGKYYLRYNIGINGYNEWTNVCCVYSSEDFNRDYEVIK